MSARSQQGRGAGSTCASTGRSSCSTRGCPSGRSARFRNAGGTSERVDADGAMRRDPGRGRRGDPTAFVVGGLAGASRVRRSVEPGDVLVWTTAEEGDRSSRVPAARPVARGAAGTCGLPSPRIRGHWRLATRVDGLLVADPVQLWLDCASEGERALEAAEAVAEATGWS